MKKMFIILVILLIGFGCSLKYNSQFPHHYSPEEIEKQCDNYLFILRDGIRYNWSSESNDKEDNELVYKNNCLFFKSVLHKLYYSETNRFISDVAVDGYISLNTYIELAYKYFGFTEELVRDALENTTDYCAETDMIFIGDDASTIPSYSITSIEQKGRNITLSYTIKSLTDTNGAEDISGTMKIKLIGNNNFVFVSNSVYK